MILKKKLKLCRGSQSVNFYNKPNNNSFLGKVNNSGSPEVFKG